MVKVYDFVLDSVVDSYEFYRREFECKENATSYVYQESGADYKYLIDKCLIGIARKPFGGAVRVYLLSDDEAHAKSLIKEFLENAYKQEEKKLSDLLVKTNQAISAMGFKGL